MIISPRRNFIFVHIPKTGGTALATALEDRAMKDDILIGDTPKAKRRKARLKLLTAKGRIWKHSTLSTWQALLTLRARLRSRWSAILGTAWSVIIRGCVASRLIILRSDWRRPPILARS